MSRSLQYQLTRKLSAVIMLFGLMAAVASFVLSFSEAREFQDDLLQQIAVLGVRDTSALAVDMPVSDPESRIWVFHVPDHGVPGQTVPDWLSAELGAGFHTLPMASGDLRVYVYTPENGPRVLVAQATEARDEVAWASALRTLAPLLLLLPLLCWLMVRILQREFAAVGALTNTLDEQEAERLEALDEAGLPREILPFVQAINRLLLRVGDLMQQQRRFIADAAHELRSPLTALSLQIQNLEQVSSPAELQQRIQPLHLGIGRARQLAEQLLELARTQSVAEPPEPVEVHSLVLQLLAEFHPYAEAGHIDLGLEDNARCIVSAHRESLRLILSNALDNALKYTPAGGSVTLHLSQKQNMAVIEVIDTGPGIPAVEFSRVFDPFYRIPGSPGVGSGLGLSIAREAAARNGGVMTLARGVDGVGLVFGYRQLCRAL